MEEKNKITKAELFALACQGIVSEDLSEEDLDIVQNAITELKEHYKGLSEEDLQEEIEEDKIPLKERLENLGVKIKEDIKGKISNFKETRQEKKKEKELQELERLEEKYRK